MGLTADQAHQRREQNSELEEMSIENMEIETQKQWKIEKSSRDKWDIGKEI